MTLNHTPTFDPPQNTRRPIDSPHTRLGTSAGLRAMTGLPTMTALALAALFWNPVAQGQTVTTAADTTTEAVTTEAVTAEAPAAPTMTDAEQREAGKRLLAEVIAAHGGDAFVSQRSQVSKGEGMLRPLGQAQAGNVPSITVTKVFPERHHVAMDLGSGSLVQRFDGSQGSVESTNASGETTVGDLTEFFQKRQFFGFDILRRTDLEWVARKLENEEADGVSWERLEIELDSGQTTRFYFEPGKRLVSIVIYVLDGETVTEKYSRYSAVEGVQVPHRIELFQRKAKVLDFEVNSVEVNTEVASELFGRPAS